MGLACQIISECKSYQSHTDGTLIKGFGGRVKHIAHHVALATGKDEQRLPMYVMLREAIAGKIESGEYLPGEKLPGERVLADIYDVNRMTVKNAVNAFTVIRTIRYWVV